MGNRLCHAVTIDKRELYNPKLWYRANLASFSGPCMQSLASCGSGIFVMCVMRRVETCVGEDCCSVQLTKEGSESTLLVATLRSLFVPKAEH